jgi:hypothetical protein
MNSVESKMKITLVKDDIRVFKEYVASVPSLEQFYDSNKRFTEIVDGFNLEII